MNKVLFYIQHHPLKVLYIIAIPVLLINNLIPGNYDFDSHYYIYAISNILNLRIDCLRTPVYPIILHICSFIGQPYIVFGVTLFQSVLFLLSIYFFYRIGTILIPSKKVSFCITLFYTLIPAPNWCSMILTESLSISGMIFITWLILKDFPYPTWSSCIKICLLVIVLIFLRPTFIIFLAIIPALYIYQSIIDKKFHLQVIPLSIIPLFCYLFYCGAYQKEYDIYTSSFSGTCNKIYNLKRAELWNPNLLENDDERLVCHYIDSIWDGSYNYLYPLESNSPKQLKSIDDMCNTMINKQKKLYHNWQALLFLWSCDESMSIWPYNRRSTVGRPVFIFSKLFSIHLSFFYCLLIISVLLLIIKITIRKKINIQFALLVGICSSHCIGICLSGAEAYGRLMLPVYPLFLIIVGYLFIRLLDFTIACRNK